MSSMNEPFDAVDVIRTKRDGGRLSDPQIDWVIDAYTRGVVAEEQPVFLKIVYNGRRATEELAQYDPSRLVVGVLGVSSRQGQQGERQGK